MRQIISILFFLISFSASATTYYVASWGENNRVNNDGSESEPWATVSYALNFVTAGDVIYIDGIITETSQINLPAGVTLTGAGIRSSVIKAGAALSQMIYCYSSTLTNGNQSISHITIDGNMVAQF